ncbi:MAG: lipoyl(octanoyl) transferase [Deltaproteobacteria bacterium RBG_13_53_10]|nr:MAG: lipoyl(octanoyl) transferase [Deltaproteobacteria bacterium RBG_13_53_10]
MLRVWELGTTEYGEAWNLQKRLRCERLEGRIPDRLVLLEHPPTITIGKSGTLDHVLVSREELARQGISLFFVDRGGDVTYHGPGQLVGYPILNLRERGSDLHSYVHCLEEVILRTLGDFSIEADRDASHPGVWANGEEVAAIGLSVKKWVSMHGFALNVNVDLEHFSFIHPCGLLDTRATSMSKILGRCVPMADVKNRLIFHFCEVFGFRTAQQSSTERFHSFPARHCAMNGCSQRKRGGEKWIV